MTPKEMKVVFTLIGTMLIIMITVMIVVPSKKEKANASAQNRQDSEIQGVGDFIQGTVENNLNGGSTNNADSNTLNNDVSGENNNVVDNNIVSGENSNTADNNTSSDENNDTQTNIKPPIVGVYKQLIVTNVEYRTEDGGNKIVASITNSGSTIFPTEVAKLTLIKSTGEQIQNVITIPSINAGETVQFEHLLDEDASDIAEIKIEEI